MAFGHGSQAEVLMAGWRMSNYLNSVDSSLTGEAAETTVFNSSGAKSYIPGKIDATLSAEGFFDGSTSSVENTLKSALASTAQQVWSVWPQGTAVGNYGFGVLGLQTTYDISTPVDGVVSISLESQSKIGRDRLVSLRAYGNASTSSTGTSVDNTAATTKGGVGYFQRTDSSTRGVTPLIQHSSAGSSWATLVAFSSGTSKGGQRVAMSGSVKRYVRAKWTLTGSTAVPTTLQFGFSRK